MNAVRIQNRRTAHDEGAWVREAAAEYARKTQLARRADPARPPATEGEEEA
jgi:ring-1,2-phenylacetyl-CoA epoxidase subunit PaaA